ncbi:MAG: beta-lactamase family protein [Myxococcales bacterium]|nr:beta-lactamase family protein [Myxococcales bacterium]
MRRLEELLASGVREEIFPLARAEVLYEGRRVFSGGNAREDTAFDLASVTKVLCTTALCLELKLFGSLRRWLPSAAVDVGTLELLFHRSGLPPFVQYFEEELKAHPELFDADCPVRVREAVRFSVLSRALQTRPEAAPGEKATYSDIGFILLGAALEAASGRSLDELFVERIAEPLGLSAGFRRLSRALPLPESLADTGNTRPREHAPGQEGSFTVPFHPARRGEVDDDNAWCLDGVSGHAGLFGTAHDVATFGQAVLRGELAPPVPWHHDASTPGSTRACGFDTPGADAPSCGPRFGKKGPRGAIGHLGFTGTSLWIDLDRQLVVALLTNRVALGRANLKIREFRPRFHEAVLDALSLA